MYGRGQRVNMSVWLLDNRSSAAQWKHSQHWERLLFSSSCGSTPALYKFASAGGHIQSFQGLWAKTALPAVLFSFGSVPPDYDFDYINMNRSRRKRRQIFNIRWSCTFALSLSPLSSWPFILSAALGEQLTREYRKQQLALPLWSQHFWFGASLISSEQTIQYA